MTNEPLAYAAVAADGSESVYVASLKEQAEACCRENGWLLVPLYAGLLLTDAEREAIDYAWCSIGRDDALSERQAEELRETLERLLERTRESHRIRQFFCEKT